MEVHIGDIWRTESSACCGDAALCQITSYLRIILSGYAVTWRAYDTEVDHNARALRSSSCWRGVEDAFLCVLTGSQPADEIVAVLVVPAVRARPPVVVAPCTHARSLARPAAPLRAGNVQHAQV